MIGSESGGSPLLDWIVLWRSGMEDHYTQQEATLLAAIWPHLSQALELNRCVNSVQLFTRDDSRRNALAIVDRRGEICLADPEFGMLVREEWAWWEGQSLPPRVAEALVVRGMPRFRGANVQFESNRSEELFVVRVRRLNPMDRLSERERDIALRYSEGASYKEIARELAIAPSTVRNRLQDVYRKVGVGDKAELATLIAGRRNVS
jgi:DNA-binding CsgD family transcriptional regulator